MALYHLPNHANLVVEVANSRDMSVRLKSNEEAARLVRKQNTNVSVFQDGLRNSLYSKWFVSNIFRSQHSTRTKCSHARHNQTLHILTRLIHVDTTKIGPIGMITIPYQRKPSSTSPWPDCWLIANPRKTLVKPLYWMGPPGVQAFSCRSKKWLN